MNDMCIRCQSDDTADHLFMNDLHYVAPLEMMALTQGTLEIVSMVHRASKNPQTRHVPATRTGDPVM